MKNMHGMSRALFTALWGVVIASLAAPILANATDGSQKWGFEGLTGTWRVQVKTYDCRSGVENPPFSSFLTFDSGGSVTGTTSNAAFLPGQRSSDHGIWKRVGGNYFIATSEAFIQFSTPAGSPTPPLVRGVQRIEQGIELTGRDSFRSEATLTFFDAGGSVVLAGCATASAHRFR
jgi:hypothetical protein